MDAMFLIESSYSSKVGHSSLIDEKISMPVLTNSGSRARLRALLDKSVKSCNSTIISGRAGTGKTALVLDFAKNSGLPVAWYKVDAPEAEIASFFQYLVGSIQRERPHFGSKVLVPLTKTADHDQNAGLVEAFLYELVEDESDPLLIVIEDLHLVFDSEWLVPFLRRMLPLLPAEVHMIITSRTVPPAPLWRMRSKQTLSVIDEATLAYTRHEAIELFESYGLTSEQASVALDDTHGRASALIRIATSLVQQESSLRVSSVAYVA
jgi:LuxR family transcriptional regulator, maltose regulon positive regulatory protein